MSVLWWLLAGFIAYWFVVIGLDRAGSLPPAVQTQGPILTIHTGRGRALLTRLARYRRFWRAWGNVGLGVALVIMAGMFFVVINAGITAMFSPERTAIREPQNVLVIPGVNEFLPLSVAPEIVIGLLVGLVVHEGGHGLLCRVENIDIDSMGIALLAFVPVGAFVEPDEESQRAADRGSASRMFAAGVMNNFAVTIVTFALLFWLVGATVAVAPGAPVGHALDGSAADEAGIGSGDRIVGVDGTEIATADELDRALRTNDRTEVSVELGSGETTTVERSLLVVTAVPDGPTGIGTEARIVRIDGQPVDTEAALSDHLASERVVTFETADGTSATVPAGGWVPLVEEGGPLDAAGVPAGTTDVVITAIDGERITSTGDAEDLLAETTPGQRISIEAFVADADGNFPSEPTTYEAELGTHEDGHGYLGVVLQPGTTGITVSDFGAQLYPAESFLATIGGDVEASSIFGLDSFFGQVFSAMVLPVAGLIGLGIGQNFAGFTGHATGFYEVQGALAGAPALVFLTANVLFWTGWINLNLGVFNCIPAFPLDGGHLLRTSAESVIARLPIGDRYVAVKYVTVSVGLLMLAGLVLMIFGQGLLS